MYNSTVEYSPFPAVIGLGMVQSQPAKGTKALYTISLTGYNMIDLLISDRDLTWTTS